MIAILLLVYIIGYYFLKKCKVEFPVYLIIIEHPFKQIIKSNCNWIDSIFELIFILGFIYFLVRRKFNIKIPTKMTVFIAIYLMEIVVYSIVNCNISFIARSAEFKYYLGILVLIIYMYCKIDTRERLISLLKIISDTALLFMMLGWGKYFFFHTYVVAVDNDTNRYALYIFLGIMCKYLQYALETEFYSRRSIIYYTIFGAVTIFFSKSTSVLICLCLSLCIFILYKILNMKLIGKVFGIISFIYVFVSAFCIKIVADNTMLNYWFIEKLMARKGYYDTTRAYIWREAIDTFKNNWLLGEGSDVFRATIGPNSYVTHNDWLSLLVNMGIIGFGAFFVFTVCVIKDTIHISDKRMKAIFFACIGSMYTFMLSHNCINFFMFWIIIAIMYIFREIYNKSERVNIPLNENQRGKK